MRWQDLRITFRPRPDDEEGSPGPVTTQHIQQKRGVHGVRAVVEREVYDRAGSFYRLGGDARRRVVQAPATDGAIRFDAAREPVPGRDLHEVTCRGVRLTEEIRTQQTTAPPTLTPHE